MQVAASVRSQMPESSHHRIAEKAKVDKMSALRRRSVVQHVVKNTAAKVSHQIVRKEAKEIAVPELSLQVGAKQAKRKETAEEAAQSKTPKSGRLELGRLKGTRCATRKLWYKLGVIMTACAKVFWPCRHILSGLALSWALL